METHRDKDATKMMAATGKFYEMLTEKLTPEERQALNERIKKETEFPSELGTEIKKAIFNFVCPDTGALVAASGFNAYGNINSDNGEIEAVLTVECKACKKEHSVTVISFPEMLSMPAFISTDKDRN